MQLIILCVGKSSNNVEVNVNYRCCFCEEYGPVWRKDMNEKPVVYMQPAHSSIRLRCDADGKPRPSIRWYKDGKDLPSRPFGKV